jgi:hypothetical protein
VFNECGRKRTTVLPINTYSSVFLEFAGCRPQFSVAQTMSEFNKKKKLCSALIINELIVIEEEQLLLESICEERKSASSIIYRKEK